MTALLIGFYGLGNLGDELMLYCLSRRFRREGVDVRVVTEAPENVQRDHELPVVENIPLLGQWSPKRAWLQGVAPRLIGEISRADAVIIGGGDLIRDDRGWRQSTYVLEKLLLAQFLGKPTFVMNVGVVPLTRWYGRKLARRALARCRQIVVRDERALDVCRRLGAGAGAQYAPDIVNELARFLPASDEPSPRSGLLVCLHADPGGYGYELTDLRIENLAAAFDRWIEQHDQDVAFLPCRDDQAERDVVTHQRVLQASRHSNRMQLLDWSSDAELTGQRFRSPRAVLGMRLHAAILANAFGTPFAAMPYDGKVREFASQVDAPMLEATDLDAVEPITAALNQISQADPRPLPAPVWDQLKLNF